MEKARVVPCSIPVAMEGDSVSKVEMATHMPLICNVLFLSISTFETPPGRAGTVFVAPKRKVLQWSSPLCLGVHAVDGGAKEGEEGTRRRGVG